MRTVSLFAVTLALAAVATQAAPVQLHAVGNLLKTAKGKTVRLQGVNIASLEWMPEGDGQLMLSVTTAIEGWHANIIRLPLCEDRWFGKGERQSDGGTAYRAVVANVVKEASARNAYVLLDLHWSDVDEWGKNLGQHDMPDQHSIEFWKDVATTYKNNPGVLFDLYNEPKDVSWEVWRNGGKIDEKVGNRTVTYETPGMQKLLELIRAQGAKNLVLAGGLDWAYDLTGILQGFALKDPGGYGVLYASHIYPWKTQWDEKVGAIAAKYPVLLGEVGCEPDPKQEDPYTWAPKILAFIQKNNLNWTAWCFHPSASPCLLSDWKYTPTPYWGVFVKKALADGAAK